VGAAPRRPLEPTDADAWFDCYFDGKSIQFAEGLRDGVDEGRVRSLAVGSLRYLLAGSVPEGPRPRTDLNQPWHVLRVKVSNGFAYTGGGPVDASADYVTPARSLVTAAIAHLTE
jgi:hypothetical protein